METQKQFFIVKSLIINKEEKILLVKRDRKWHKESHGKWEFPGGKINFGETPEETCIREAKEESGINIKIDYLIPKIYTGGWVYPDRETQQIIICYKCTPISGEISIEDHGVSDVRWFKLNEISELDCLLSTTKFLDKYKEFRKINET